MILMNFLREERGQGAIEYIMLVGGIVIAAVVVSVIYEKAAVVAGAALSASVNTTAVAETKAVAAQLRGF